MSASIIYENEKSGHQISYETASVSCYGYREKNDEIRYISRKMTYLPNGNILDFTSLAICPPLERKDYKCTCFSFYDFYEEDQFNIRRGYKIVKGEENVEYFRELSGSKNMEQLINRNKEYVALIKHIERKTEISCLDDDDKVLWYILLHLVYNKKHKEVLEYTRVMDMEELIKRNREYVVLIKHIERKTKTVLLDDDDKVLKEARNNFEKAKKKRF
jgi:RNase P subunit RPR2